MKKIFMITTVASALILSTPGYADRGSGLGLGFIAGAIIGSQLAYPYYSRPIIYPPPTVIYSQPVVTAPPPQIFQYQPPNQGVWYFCPSSGTYYPYVTQCPVPWQMIPSSPQ